MERTMMEATPQPATPQQAAAPKKSQQQTPKVGPNAPNKPVELEPHLEELCDMATD